MDLHRRPSLFDNNAIAHYFDKQTEQDEEANKNTEKQQMNKKRQTHIIEINRLMHSQIDGQIERQIDTQMNKKSDRKTKNR